MELNFRTEDEERELRINDEHRLSIKEYNKQEALKILEDAGISQTNPFYNQYLALTMANVHIAKLFAVYNPDIQNMFAETLKNPNLTPEQYANISKTFRHTFYSEQLKHAEGSTHEENDANFEDVTKELKKTIETGIKMRKELKTFFPKVFSPNDKSVSRLYVDIPPELLEISAIHIIRKITSEYNDFIDFDKDNNKFIVDNQLIGPQIFFNSKIKLLKRFKPDTFEIDDTELFEIIKTADFKKLQELKKNRGINKNKTNISLINAFDDKFIFYEVTKLLKNKKISKENIEEIFNKLQENYSKNAQIISKESEKDTLDYTDSVDYTDTVMFSISPYDLATQSTFRTWKSCMHLAGLNQHYVDDSIGAGSIVVYAFSSSNPHQMVSRLLIHPYTNDKGEIAYKVNNRIYGKENLALRKIVDVFIKEYLNKDKDGIFFLNKDKDDNENGYLYNDNGDLDHFTVIKYKKVDAIDLSKYVYNNELQIFDKDLSLADDIFISKDIDCIDLNNIKLPPNLKKLDLSNCKKLIIANMDLSNIEELILPENISSLNNVKLPKNLKKLDLSNCPNLELINMDLSNIEELILPHNGNISFNKVKLPQNIKKLDLSNCSDLELINMNLSNIDELILPNNISTLNNIKLSKNIKTFDLSNVSGYINVCNIDVCNINFSNLDNLILPNNIGSIANTKFPQNVDLSNVENLTVEKLMKADFSNTTSITLPKNIHNLNWIKPEYNIKKLDLSNVEDTFFFNSSANLSVLEELIFPKKSIKVYVDGAIFHKIADFKNCQCLDVKNVDFTNTEKLILPAIVSGWSNLKFSDKLKVLDMASVRVNFKEIDLPNTEKLIPPNDLKSLDEIKLPKKLKILDLSQNKAIILDNKNLSDIDEIILQNCANVHNTVFPKKVNLKKCNTIIGADFSNVEELILPEKISTLKNTKLPKNLKVLDLSNCDNIDLSGTDLSNLDMLILPKHLGSVVGTKFPKNVDMHLCEQANLYDGDFTNTEKLILPPDFRDLSQIKISDKLKVLDMSYVKNADLSNTDLSNIHQFIPPKVISSICNTIFPEKTDLSTFPDHSSFILADFSKTEELKLHYGIKKLANVKIPKNVKILDLSECTNIDFTNANLDNITKIKLPKDFDKSRLPEGLYESSEVIRKAMYEINPNLIKIDNLKKQTKDRHTEDNNLIRPIKYAIKQIQYKLRHKIDSK